MTIQVWITIIALVLAPTGLLGFVLTLRTLNKERERDKRERILHEEMVAAKGAGLLITTSSEAINVFNVALRAAQEDIHRRDVIIEKLEKKIEQLEARVRELERQQKPWEKDL